MQEAKDAGLTYCYRFRAPKVGCTPACDRHGRSCLAQALAAAQRNKPDHSGVAVAPGDCASALARYLLQYWRKQTKYNENSTPRKASHPLLAQDQEITIDDAVRGKVTWNTNTLGDFVILRSNGQPVGRLSA